MYFREITSLEGELVSIKATLFNPTSLKVCDSILVIREKPIGHKAFKIVDLKEFNVIAEYGQFGRGPGELINPGSFFYDDIENAIWISDWTKNQFYKLPVDSVLGVTDYIPTTSIDINIGLMPMLNVFYFDHGLLGFSCFNLRRKGSILFIDYDGNLIDSLTISNSTLHGLWTDMNLSDNPYLIEYNRNKKEFAVANRHSDDILILDENGEASSRTKGSIQRALTKAKNTSGKYTTYYSVFSDEEYLYAYYVGDYPFYISSTNELIRINYPNRLLVFNWQGEGLYDIKLDHKLVYIAFDSRNRQFIGFAEDFAEGLVIYDLSHLGI